MVTVYLSQPMRGKTSEEIVAERQALAQRVKSSFPEDEEVKILESYFPDEEIDKPTDRDALWYLGACLEILAAADVAYFGKGWEDARGCRVEHTCAVEYGITVIEDYRKEEK